MNKEIMNKIIYNTMMRSLEIEEFHINEWIHHENIEKKLEQEFPDIKFISCEQKLPDEWYHELYFYLDEQCIKLLVTNQGGKLVLFDFYRMKVGKAVMDVDEKPELDAESKKCLKEIIKFYLKEVSETSKNRLRFVCGELEYYQDLIEEVFELLK